MKSTINNFFTLFKGKLFSFFKSFFRLQILIVYAFCYTHYYFLFVFFITLACFSQAQGSFLYLISKILVFFFIFSLLTLSFFLNIPWTKEKIEGLVGKTFLEKKLGLHFLGFIPFSVFLLTVSLLDLIESSTMLLKVEAEYKEKTIGLEHIKDFVDNPLTSSSLAKYLKVLPRLCELPNDFSSTGVLTEISTYFCNLF